MQKVIGKKERRAYGFAAAGSYLVCGITQSYLMYFLTDILIVSSSFVMGLMIFARIWDAINDPIMGIMIDKTHTKRGKMRPYVFYGSFVMLAITLLLFLPLTSMPPVAKMIFAAATYIIFGMTYTLVDVPAMGLMSVATPNNDERSDLLAYYVTVGTIVGLMPVALLSVFQAILPEKWVYFGMAVLVGFVAFAGYQVLYHRTVERYDTHTEKSSDKEMIHATKQNRPMVMALLMSMAAGTRYLIIPSAMYITTYVIHIPGMSSGVVLLLLYGVMLVGMLTGVFSAPKVYGKIGYKKACFAYALIGGIFLCLAFFVSKINQFACLPFLCIGGIGLGAYNVLPSPMVGDSLDYLEWKTGKRMEGTCFSLNSFVTKFNNAVGFIGLALALIIFDFVEPTTAGVPLPQSEYTCNGLMSLVTLIPGIGFLLSLIPIFFYNYDGKLREQVQSELAARKDRAHNDNEAPIGDASVIAENVLEAEAAEVTESVETAEAGHAGH